MRSVTTAGGATSITSTPVLRSGYRSDRLHECNAALVAEQVGVATKGTNASPQDTFSTAAFFCACNCGNKAAVSRIGPRKLIATVASAGVRSQGSTSISSACRMPALLIGTFNPGCAATTSVTTPRVDTKRADLGLSLGDAFWRRVLRSLALGRTEPRPHRDRKTQL